MPWATFRLGRPGLEQALDIDPDAVSIREGPVDVLHRNLAGDLKRSVLKASAPVVRINSRFLLKATRDKLASLAAVDDEHLGFLTRDDWQQLLLRALPDSISRVTLPNSSARRLSAARVAAGAAGTVTVDGVFSAKDGSGTNFFTGGSYADATGAVTLGTSLNNADNPVYVTYTYRGWLVSMRRFDHAVRSGWGDRFSYDVELTGA